MKKKLRSKVKNQTKAKLMQSFDGTDHTLNKNENIKKFSQIFTEFILPVIDLAHDNEEKVNDLASWGGFVWNMVMAEKFPEQSHNEELNTLATLFKVTTINKDLLNKYILRKKTEFNNYNFFIVDVKAQFDKRRKMTLSISVLEIEG